MSNKSELKSNNIDLQSILDTINALPEAGSGDVNIDDLFSPAFTYTVDAVPNASYGFALNSSGYYESQNKGVNNSYAICRVNLNVREVTNVVFDVINYAESTYDYAIFGNLDTGLKLSYESDLNCHENFKNRQSASVVNVTYTNVPAGSHFIDIKFIKDQSQSKNNDSVQFKVQGGTLSQNLLDKIVQADSDLVPSNIRSGVDIFGIIGTLAGGSLPNGISGIATGTFTTSSSGYAVGYLDHDLGVAPNFALVLLEKNLAYKQSSLCVCCMVFRKDVPTSSDVAKYTLYSSGFSYDTSNVYTQLTAGTSGRDFLTSTGVYFQCSTSLSFEPGFTYRWIAGVLDGIA